MANFGSIVTSVLTGALISHIGLMALANHHHRQQQPCSRGGGGGGGELLGSPPALPVEKHEACTRWYRSRPGDSCFSILQRGGLSPAQLSELNENVDNICKGELEPGAWLCLASGPELPMATAKAKPWFGSGPAMLQTGSSSTSTAAVATTSSTLPSVPPTAKEISHTALDMDAAVVPGDEPVDIKNRNDDALDPHHGSPLALPHLVSVPRMRNTWFAVPHQQSTTAVTTATDHPSGSMSTEAETTTAVTHTLSGGDADDSPTGSVGTATFTGPGDGKTAWPSSSSSSSSDLPDDGDGKTAFPTNPTTTSTVVSMVATTTSFIPVIVTTTATLSPGSSSTTPTLWRRHPRSRSRPQHQHQQRQHSPPDDNNDSNPNPDGEQLLSPELAAHCSRRTPTVDRCLAAINGAEASMLRFCDWYTDPARPAQSQTAIVQFAAPLMRHQQQQQEAAGKNTNSGAVIPPPLLPRPAALEQACAHATGAPAVLLPPLHIAAAAAAADVAVVTATAASPVPATATTRPPHAYLSSACSCLGHFDRSHRLAVAATAAAGVPGVFEADAGDVVVVDGDDSDSEEDDFLDSDIKKRSNGHGYSHSRRYLQPWWVQAMLQAYARTATDGYYAPTAAVAPRAEPTPTHTHVLPAAGDGGDNDARVMVVVTKVVTATGEKRARTRAFRVGLSGHVE